MGRFDHLGGGANAGEGSAPTDTDWVAAADKAYEAGAWQTALRLYGRALEHDRQRPQPWLGQVRALMRMGQPQEAATWLEQAGRVLGEIPPLLALRAEAAALAGRLDEARQWSDRAMRDGPDHPEVWLARAAVVYLSGNPAMGRVNLEKAHERRPGPSSARAAGELALRYGDLDTAERWLRQAEGAEPDNAVLQMNLGVLWFRRHEWERARLHLERALTLEPRLEPAKLALDDLNSRGPIATLFSGLRALWSR